MSPGSLEERFRCYYNSAKLDCIYDFKTLEHDHTIVDVIIIYLFILIKCVSTVIRGKI